MHPGPPPPPTSRPRASPPQVPVERLRPSFEAGTRIVYRPLTNSPSKIETTRIRVISSPTYPGSGFIVNVWKEPAFLLGVPRRHVETKWTDTSIARAPAIHRTETTSISVVVTLPKHSAISRSSLQSNARVLYLYQQSRRACTSTGHASSVHPSPPRTLCVGHAHETGRLVAILCPSSET